MAAASPCKNTMTTNRSRPPRRNPLLLLRAMLHSSLCFLLGLLAGLLAPSDLAAAALLAPSGVFLRALRAINDRTGGKLIVSSTNSSRRPQQPQLVVVVTTTEQSDSDPERSAAGLTRTAHALGLVSPPLLWLVVQVAPARTMRCRPRRGCCAARGVVHRHLMYKQDEARRSSMREQQRNVALRHIEDHRIAGVVLFGGLDDVYDLPLPSPARPQPSPRTLHARPLHSGVTA